MSFKYEPFTEKQIKLLTWWTDESPFKNKSGIICDGSVRSGKSLIMSLSFVFWAMQNYSAVNFGMAGKSVGTLRRNVVIQLKKLLMLRGYHVEERKTDNLFIVRKGKVSNTFYIFGGKDERSQDFVQGFTAAGFYFDEVTLMPESFVEQCIARCSVEGAKLWFNCNPEGPLHWFKINHLDKADEKNYLHLHFELHDNPSLSDETIARYEKSFTGVFHQRFILGQWVLASGIIYDSYDPERNNYEELPEAVKRDAWPYYGCDYGTANPHVYLEVYFDRRTNPLSVYVEREYYYSGRNELHSKTDDQYVKAFDEFNMNKPYHNVTIDPSAASFITAMRQTGHKVRQADNDVMPGISLLHTMFSIGSIKINAKNCPNLVKELGSYQWNLRKIENTAKEEPLKVNDHCCDALRYVIKTNVREVEIYPFLKNRG